MIKSLEIFSEAFGSCSKAKVTFKIKENVTQIFWQKSKVPFADKTSISKELHRLEQIGVLTNTDDREWASPIVYVKKKAFKKTCSP